MALQNQTKDTDSITVEMVDDVEYEKRHWKAYSTAIGGCIWMLVSALGLILHQYSGSIYVTGVIEPYIASYYKVPITQLQYLLPAINVIQCIVLAAASTFIKKVNPKL